MNRKIDFTLRALAWGGAIALWLLPLVAMQFSSEMAWTAFDFAAWGAMLLVACGVFELGMRLSPNFAYRAGFAVAAGTAFLITWSNLAVGIVGDEGQPLNLIFFGVIAVAVIGAFFVNFRASGMTKVMTATAILQAATAIAAVVHNEIRVVAIIGGFAMAWLLSAWLFRKAASEAVAVV